MHSTFFFTQRSSLQAGIQNLEAAFKPSITRVPVQNSRHISISSRSLCPRPAIKTSSHPDHTSDVSPSKTSFSKFTMPPPRQHARSRLRPSASTSRNTKPAPSRGPDLPGPLHDRAYVSATYNPEEKLAIKRQWEENPKDPLIRYSLETSSTLPAFTSIEGNIGPKRYSRSTILIDGNIIGVGDATSKKEAEKIAAYSAILQLSALGRLDTKSSRVSSPVPVVESVTLSDGSVVNFDRARQFMDYYCRRFNFGKPDITFETPQDKKRRGWDAAMVVGGRRIGLGTGNTKKAAMNACYLDVTQYLQTCDPDLWKTFLELAAVGKDGPGAPKVSLQMSETVEESIRDLCSDIRKSTLFLKRPETGSRLTGSDLPEQKKDTSQPIWRPQPPSEATLQTVSDQLLDNYLQYQGDPKHEAIQLTRASLPISTRAEDILAQINENEVTICMAATGSGKTTQIPQIILDDWIKQKKGGKCKIICTQPRRIAAISVASRVAWERGEQLGGTVGYQVRFEGKLPQEHGSITFCTTGIFLKWMQSSFQEGRRGPRTLDGVTHILVDEVHERDIDTDLVLVSLKRLMAERRVNNQPLKVVLMSATIDPALFQSYFADEQGQPAKVAEIPGRSFPVDKVYLEDVIRQICEANPQKMKKSEWVFRDKSVVEYVHNEIGPHHLSSLGFPHPPIKARESESGEDLELPSPLIALTIAHVILQSSSGHVLAFLPGWEEITSVQKILMDKSANLLGLDFTDTDKFSIHLLHSTIPIIEQQAVFEPAPDGVRRIILATNIAETSITIPDVVYVVDSGKVKENRYDPDRRMSSLVSAWVGLSNLNQRAGRAGRHRPGEYFSMVSTSRLPKLNPYQLVEMKRVDLSGIVMHVKALDFPGMEVEDVLARTIEPPDHQRVQAAIQNMVMVGALDEKKNLTSLGRVLLQLPVEAQIGRLVLFGSFFRCLDQALTLAAILTNRDPFMSPPLLKKESNVIKTSWSPPEFRSDALAALRAFNAWWELQSTAQYAAANRFCNDNFLSKPTLLLMQRIKLDLLKALDRAGILEVSAGGSALYNARTKVIPPELNRNGESMPLLAGLIAIGSQPNFAVKVSDKVLRTARDRTVLIHPSSINNRKRELPPGVKLEDDPQAAPLEKQIFAFAEKTQNVSAGQTNPQTFLKGSTRLDPMTYVLFGAYDLVVTERGLECDEWLPIVGNIHALDDVQRLKTLMESSMLRVFEGIINRRNRNTPRLRVNRDAADEEDYEDYEARDTPLSDTEIKELDSITHNLVKILDLYSEERLSTQSRYNSRPATPTYSPLLRPMSLPSSASRSGHSTPYNPGSAYNSRPGTPSKLRSSAMY